jgi:hypothetical protein
MAKNYKALYESSNDSLSLEQRWYAVAEASKGTLQAPTNSDFFFTLGGGSIEFSQPFETSPHRSGRHHTSNIKKKKECSFSFSTYFNIDESLPSASLSEVDPAVRLLFRSAFGTEVISSGSPVFNTSSPADFTFSLFEVGDKWSRQARAAFVQGCNMQFPGNGEATIEWSGNAAESILVGIAKTETNNTANTITLLAGEEDRVPVGSLIMIIKSDGTTRSSDTPAGSSRRVVSKAGNVITVSGAVLADANGTAGDVFIAYYEPAAPVAINNPVTGLVGSMTVASTTHTCFRSFGLQIANDHELSDYCYGRDALDAPFFVPGSRFTATVTAEVNLNDEIIALFNRVVDFEAQEMNFTLGSASGRRFTLSVPKVQFPVPSFSVPDSGSVPVSFSGNALQSSFDAADEVIASFV